VLGEYSGAGGGWVLRVAAGGVTHVHALIRPRLLYHLIVIQSTENFAPRVAQVEIALLSV